MIQTHSLVERRSILLSAAFIVVAVAVAGCAGSDAFRPGESDMPLAAPDSRGQRAPQPAVKWELASTIASMKVLQERFTSRGHRMGDLQARWLANDVGAAAFPALRRGEQMPRGAVLVSQHTVRGNGAPAGAFAMVKRDPGFFPEGGDWEWIAIGSDDNIVARGKLAACARCHADAVADFVFPVATQPAQP
jgi:hypothetical protein